MKKVIKACSFVLIFIVIYIYASIVFIPKSFADPGGAKYYRGKGYISEPKNSLDIIALGNSDLYCGFTPLHLYELTGYTAYSCGVSKQNLAGVYNSLEDSTNYQSPKLIILETDCLYAPLKKKRNNKNDDFINKSVFIFKNHSRWKKLKLRDFTKLPDPKAKDYLKGYVFRENVSNFEFVPYMGNIDDKPRKLPPRNLEMLNKIIDFCNEKNYQILFVEFPSATSWNYAKHNFVKEFTDELGIPFIDMNLLIEEIGIIWEKDYCDMGNHLNFDGSRKTTKYLADYLKEHYELIDHRDDKAYSDWQKSLEIYHKQLKKTI